MDLDSNSDTESDGSYPNSEPGRDENVPPNSAGTVEAQSAVTSAGNHLRSPRCTGAPLLDVICCDPRALFRKPIGDVIELSDDECDGSKPVAEVTTPVFNRQSVKREEEQDHHVHECMHAESTPKSTNAVPSCSTDRATKIPKEEIVQHRVVDLNSYVNGSGSKISEQPTLDDDEVEVIFDNSTVDRIHQICDDEAAGRKIAAAQVQFLFYVVVRIHL